MTDCAACPQAVIAELTELADLTESSCLPANPHLYTEHDV